MRRVLSLTSLLAFVLLLAWCFSTHNAPAGQPALAHLDPASVATLQSDFNRAAREVRIIVLLSPT